MKSHVAMWGASVVLPVLGVVVFSGACGGAETPVAAPVASASASASAAPISSVAIEPSASASAAASASPAASASATAPTGPTPTIIVQNLNHPDRLILAGDALYWAEPRAHTVMTAPKAGGEAKVVAENQKGVAEVAADAKEVFWVTSDGKGGGTVMKVARKGGKPTKLATIDPHDLGGPTGIDLDDANVYWINSTNSGSVMRVGKTGGLVTAIASAQKTPYDLAVGPSGVYWTNFGAGLAGGSVSMVPIKKGFSAKPIEPTVIASGQKSPWCIAIDETSAYWLNTGDHGAVMKVALAGGTPIVLAADVRSPSCLAIDKTDVYWTSEDEDSIRKVPKAGGSASLVAGKQGGPSGVAVDDSGVYWSNKASGTIAMVSKK